MQKIHKVIITLILAALIINVLPFKLFADNTYDVTEWETFTMPNGTRRYGYSVNIDTFNFSRFISSTSTSSDSPVRYTYGVNDDGDLYVYCVSTYQYPGVSYTFNADNGLNQVSIGGIKTSKVVDNVTYYVLCGSVTSSYNTSVDYLVPVVFNDSLSNDNSINTAIYYTFGEGAETGPDMNFGSLKIGFKTDIAYSGGNQDAWRLNKDTIYFDRYDTLGNDLFGYNIELQAVPFSVYDSSQSNVISKTVNDYLYDTVHVGSLGYWSPGQDYIDFTWEYITTRFSPVWWSTYGDNWSFTGWALENQWYRVGWSYRARLVDDEYNELIPWQWIYNGTSIDGPDVNNIVNNNGLTPDLVNSINNINNYNNTTNNNTYNNQTINYYSSDQESDGSWIEALLESILGTIADLVGKILDFFKSILDGLLDLILGLFGDVDPAGSFFNWFSDLFNGIGDIDLTLPQFNLPNEDLTSFNRLVQETLNIFSSNNIAFLIFIPLIILIIRAVF